MSVNQNETFVYVTHCTHLHMFLCDGKSFRISLPIYVTCYLGSFTVAHTYPFDYIWNKKRREKKNLSYCWWRVIPSSYTGKRNCSSHRNHIQLNLFKNYKVFFSPNQDFPLYFPIFFLALNITVFTFIFCQFEVTLPFPWQGWTHTTSFCLPRILHFRFMGLITFVFTWARILISRSKNDTSE